MVQLEPPDPGFCVPQAAPVAVDLSVHSVRFFADGHVNIFNISLYYLYSFSMHLDLFFAVGFLLSVLKVLSDLTHHFELITLQMAGISKRRLSRPLFFLASTLTLCSYANSEWIAPNALESIDSFRDTHAKRKKHAQREHVHAVTLDDGSEIVYQEFDPHRKILFDAYWIRSPDELWHMKIIELKRTPLLGRYTDHFVRNAKGQLAIAESFERRSLPDLPLNPSQAAQKFVPFEQRPLWTLFSQSLTPCADQDMIRAHLHYKLALPLLPILIALALPPILLQFSRRTPTFLIAACSLFVVLSILTIMDGMLILAENRVVNPLLAIWIPWLLCLIGSLRPFLRCV